MAWISLFVSDNVLMDRERVLGVDACPAGWVAIALSAGETRAYVAPEISSLVDHAVADGPVAVVGIDIPIGLADAAPRQADLLARRAAGARRASVFVTPVRAAVEAGSYELAVAANRRLGGTGISRQAFALREKILQVDRWVRQTPLRVAEVHPELSFAAMAAGPLAERKVTWAGMTRRRSLLAASGVTLADDLGPAGRLARTDDVLDAAAVAWTALRILRAEARSLPDPPEILSDGYPCAIWT